MTVSIEIATTPNPPILETLISRYLAIIKFRFWFNLNLHQGIWVSEFGGFRCCSIFSGNSHVISPFQRGGLYQSCIHMYVFMFNVLLHVYMYIFFWSNQQILYLHAISLLSKGGLISFIMYIYVFMFNVFLHIFVNISGALHKFCMYIFTYIISLLSTGRITSFVYSLRFCRGMYSVKNMWFYVSVSICTSALSIHFIDIYILHLIYIHSQYTNTLPMCIHCYIHTTL